jgi:carboxymethylenebutenolidase
MCELDGCGVTARRGFLKQAGAALALSSVASSGWAEAPAPLGTDVAFDSSVGEVRGYLALPKDLRPAPGVVVLHGEIGLPPAHKMTADELAGAGFAALAIERFSRIAGFGWEQMQEDSRGSRRFLTNAFAKEEDHEAIGALTFLANHHRVGGSKQGAVGFCGGGIRAVRLGLAAPRIGAVVSFYGPPVIPPQYKHDEDPIQDLTAVASEIRFPLQMHYGTNDYAVKGEDVDELASIARRNGVEVDVYAYPAATHAFYDRTNAEAFAPAAAELARSRYLAFLSRHLARDAALSD